MAAHRTLNILRLTRCSAVQHQVNHATRPGGFPLLTEAEVQRSFRNLFKSKDVPPETFDKAETLLDELRPESPLRHRLSIELEEIRKLHTAKV